MIVEEGHLAAWARLRDRVEIVGIADRAEKRLEAIANRLNLPEKACFTDYH